jgi:hypothetical protein
MGSRADRGLSPLEKAERGYRWESTRAALLRAARRLEQAAAAQALANGYRQQLVEAGLFADEAG